MMNIIKNPLVSVSDLKKSPMKIVELSKSLGDAVYILNNNKDVGVIIDTSKYKELISTTNNLKKENEELNQRMIYLEAELRLATNKRTFSDSEVRGSDRADIELSEIDDEWE